MTIEQMKDKMIARRVSKGYNEAETREELEHIIKSYGRSGQVYALHYQQFATTAFANKFVEAVNA